MTRAILITLLLFLGACGAKVRVDDALKLGTPRTVAVLPMEYPPGVTRERVQYIRESLLGELKNSGFTVLDDTITMRVCSSPVCPERAVLSEKYFADGFFALEVASVSRNNFLAGYYNSIRGKLSLANREGKNLIVVDNTESERGGLLFNSGQIIQGVISQIRNADVDAFERLADAFVRTLVGKIPVPGRSVAANEGGSVSIGAVTVSKSKDDGDTLCVTGTPDSAAFLLVGRDRTNLRETKPGTYCARLRIEDLSTAAGAASVELRSPYGSIVRQPLDLALDACEIRGLVRVQRDDGKEQVVIQCTKTVRSKPVGDQCGTVQTCEKHRFFIYHAKTAFGPFRKVGETRGPEWSVPKGLRTPEAVFQVVAVDEHGDFSVPVRAKIVTEAKG